MDIAPPDGECCPQGRAIGETDSVERHVLNIHDAS
jgi:hypothetical protein